MPGVFFRLGRATFQTSNSVRNFNKLICQVFESLIIGDLVSNLLSVIGLNALRAFGSFQKTLQNEIGSQPDFLTITFAIKELLTKTASPEAIDGLDFLKDLISFEFQFSDGIGHGQYCIETDTTSSKK